MKKTIFVGLATLLTVSMTSSVFAAPKGTDSVRDIISHEMKAELKDRLTKMGIMKNGVISPILDAQALAVVKKQASSLIAAASHKTALRENSIEASIKRNADLVSVAESILIAKESVDREKSTGSLTADKSAEIASLENSIDLQIRFLNQANRLALTETSVTSAVKKVESLFTDMLSKFSLEERNSYNEIIKVTVEQLEGNSALDLETAFTNALTKVEGLKDKAALEKKLQEIIGCSKG
jgi:hypothetical protein